MAKPLHCTVCSRPPQAGPQPTCPVFPLGSTLWPSIPASDQEGGPAVLPGACHVLGPQRGSARPPQCECGSMSAAPPWTRAVGESHLRVWVYARLPATSPSFFHSLKLRKGSGFKPEFQSMEGQVPHWFSFCSGFFGPPS